MRLEILDPDKELDLDFGHWLCTRIKQHFVNELDARKLVNWDLFFQESASYTNIYGSPVKAYDVLAYGIKSLTATKLPDKVVISLNKNQYVPGLDRVKVDTLFRLITFGNVSVSGYPLFLDTLQYFGDNINDFVELYMEEID